ncbi:molecular chaperone [Rhodoferax sp.]|uniref:TorD/DmsD family molecular chaperone n=1 Tax=Rhodoferax sp. TaxID=50421 RepID=UPI002627766A|nr:molecular chaperone TorD family protein [Rhodoferax sp.]MDD2926433.1 molecular chaperone TorD family protein [Rhodoferax sp.]
MSNYDPDEATAGEDLCRFLSACFYEPAPEFAEEKLFDSILLAAQRLGPEWADAARKLGTAFAAQDLQTLLVDYTRLFLGPVNALAQPYGAFWLKAPEPSDDNPPPAVLQLYSEGGFDIDDEFSELPDHVAVELEFLYLLSFNANRAQAAGELEALAATKQLQRRFLSEHLGAWIDPFAAAVQASAETDFYRELAAFTQRFVHMQATRLAVH